MSPIVEVAEIAVNDPAGFEAAATAARPNFTSPLVVTHSAAIGF